jgi:hypothetical protein
VVHSLDGVAEVQGDAGSFSEGDAVVDRLAEEVLVGEVEALGAAGARAVQGELDGVKEGGLAAAIDAADEHGGPVLALPLNGGEVEDLLAVVEAEVAQA